MGYKASDGRTYSSAAAASRANSRIASSPNIGSSSSSSSSSTSKGGSSSSKGSSSSSSGGTYKYNPTTGYYERTDGGTNTYSGKGGSTVTVGGGKVTTTGGNGGGSSRTITGGYMQNGKLYNEYSDGTTGLASESGGAGSKSNTSKLSSNISSNPNVGEKKKEDYTSSSWENYTNAYNHYKEQGMSDANARAQASAFLENENLLGGNKKEYIPMIENNDKDEFDPMDTINEVMKEDDEYGEENPEMNEQIVPERRETEEGRDEYLKNYVSDAVESAVAPYLDRLEQSNVVKTSIPEEKDTSYDYNTYYKENLAPNTKYESGESKNTLNDKPQTTLVSQYQEPVTTALNDLGLLTPNEEASTSMPNTEEQPAAPETYTSGEELVSDFNNTLEQMGQEGGTIAPQTVAQTYIDFKNKLDKYANDNNLTAEEKEVLLQQLKSNETLNNLLRNK